MIEQQLNNLWKFTFAQGHFQRYQTFTQGGFLMFTQKTLQDLILHHSLEQQSFSAVVLLQVLNQVAERLDNIEALLEKRQQTEKQQMQEVKRAMLSKVTGQLNHLEKTHLNTINDLTAEVKAVKQALENAKSKFIGFE